MKGCLREGASDEGAALEGFSRDQRAAQLEFLELRGAVFGGDGVC